jgi:hypothetical protein
MAFTIYRRLSYLCRFLPHLPHRPLPIRLYLVQSTSISCPLRDPLWVLFRPREILLTLL